MHIVTYRTFKHKLAEADDYIVKLEEIGNIFYRPWAILDKLVKYFGVKS